MNPKLEKIINPVRTFADKHKQLFISIVVLAAAFLIFFALRSFKKPPAREQTPLPAPLVEVQEIKKQDITIVVTGYGTAKAKVEVEIVPQVSGKVVSVNPQFKAGGFIRAGETIFKIDPRDYELAVRQAEAGVADAQVELDMEKAEAAVAMDEWRQLHPGTEPDSPLVLREPQIKQAKASLDSAEAALDTAKLNLERTNITLPIDVRIVSQTIDLGQFATVGQSVGSAYGVDAIEIDVPLEDKELAWFDIPDEQLNFNGNKEAGIKGSPVIVKAMFADKEHTWQGYVKRTTGQVNPKSRMVSVVVEVPEPFGKSEANTALMPGLFVETQIKGDVLKDAFAIPRNAIREGNTVWSVNDNKLHIKQLEVIRKDKKFAYVVSGLDDMEKIVTSGLDVVVDGMTVRAKE